MNVNLDFRCPHCGDVQECFVPMNTKTVECIDGCADSIRIISGTSFQLDGTDPAYPTASDRWAKQHEKHGGQTE